MVDLSYVNKVFVAHGQMQVKDLGAFPPPTEETIIAAEVIKERLKQLKVDDTMAVSVTHLENQFDGKRLFVVAPSGDHPGLSRLLHRPTVDSALDLALRSFNDKNNKKYDNSDASFALVSHLDTLYNPMHSVSQDFFKVAFGSSWTPSAGVTATAISSALAYFGNTLFTTLGDFATEKTQNLSSKNKKQALAGPLASALALRMEIVPHGDVPAAVRSVRTFMRDAKTKAKTANKAKFTDYVAFMDRLLVPPCLAIDGSLVDPFPLTKLATNDKDLDNLSDQAITAWGGGPFGRYCAEPKAYGFIRNRFGIFDQGGGKWKGNLKVLGQLAFWYSDYPQSTQQARTFKVKSIIADSGSNIAQGNGAYMVPCSSCASRSGSMVAGLL